MLRFGHVADVRTQSSSDEATSSLRGDLLIRCRIGRLELSDSACRLDRSMFDETDNLLRDIGAELVFGLVAPVGADLERLEADLIDLLGLYGYATNPIRLSALLRKVPALRVELKESPEVDRINSYM